MSFVTDLKAEIPVISTEIERLEFTISFLEMVEPLKNWGLSFLPNSGKLNNS